MDIMMKRIVIAALVGMAVAGCGREEKAQTTSPAAASTKPAADVSGDAHASTTSAPLAEATPSTQQVSATAAQLKAYQCAGGPKCDESSPVHARNQAEAEWLYRNGYPSQAQLDEWAGLSDDQLKRVAASGNVAALAVYAERVAKGGNVMGGLAMSKAATDRGSLYAYHVLSDILMMPSPMQDQYDAMAYLRVAHMLGDNKAANELYRKFPNRGVPELRIADQRASSLYITFVRGRRPTPRPLE